MRVVRFPLSSTTPAFEISLRRQVSRFRLGVVFGLTAALAGQTTRGLRLGLAAMGSGAVLAGVMLAIAAVYEAATLIVLGGR